MSEKLQTPASPHLFIQRLHPKLEKIAREDEVVFSLEPKVAAKVSRMLLNPDKAWQPTQLLPDFNQPDWIEKTLELRAMAAGLSKGVIVATAGNGITEEGAPLYARALERIPIFADPEGRSFNGFGQWGAGWDAEENRHKVVFDRWMMLSGRVDMQAYDRTVHYFIRHGFGSRIGTSVYNALIFTSNQEPATETSHGRTALLAQSQGDAYLHRLSWKTKGDEARHGEFYQWLFGEVFNLDPNGAVVAVDEMLSLNKGGVLMPGALMSDRRVPNLEDITQTQLFQDYSAVTQGLGIYTAKDYVDINREILSRWKVFERTFDTPEARAAQDNLGKFTDRLGTALQRAMDMKNSSRTIPPTFSWIHNEPVPLADLKAQVEQLKAFQAAQEASRPKSSSTSKD